MGEMCVPREDLTHSSLGPGSVGLEEWYPEFWYHLEGNHLLPFRLLGLSRDRGWEPPTLAREKSYTLTGSHRRLKSRPAVRAEEQ